MAAKQSTAISPTRANDYPEWYHEKGRQRDLPEWVDGYFD
jgi:hypothetical protein